MTKAQKLEQLDAVLKDKNRLELAIHDIMNGSVIWGAWVREPKGGRYRYGISRLSSYPICIQQWRVLGQRDAINVFDLEPWREELRRLRGNSDAWEVNCQALYKALEAADEPNERVGIRKGVA